MGQKPTFSLCTKFKLLCDWEEYGIRENLSCSDEKMVLEIEGKEGVKTHDLSFYNQPKKTKFNKTKIIEQTKKAEQNVNF